MKLSILSFLIIYKIQVYQVVAEYYKECHSSDITEEQFDLMIRLSPNSKYMYNRRPESDSKSYSQQSCGKGCTSLDMDMAEITSLADFKSISKYMKSLEDKYQPKSRVNWISGTDEDDEGIWTYKTRKIFTFQQFYGWNPLDASFTANKLADYVLLFNAPDTLDSGNYDFVMLDAESEQSDHYSSNFCQFKRKNRCYKNSDEEKLNAEVTTELRELGSCSSKKYFIGTTQKDIFAARASCESKSKELLNLKISKGEAKDLYKLLRDFLFEEGLIATSNSFLIEGRDISLFEEDNQVPWEWLDDRILDQTQDPIQSLKKGQRKFGRCLSIGTLFTNSTVFSVSRSLCTLPRWYICQSDGNDPDPGQSSTTESAGPPDPDIALG